MTDQTMAVSPNDPLAGAASITLILHGVGDHSAVDIRSAARTGLTTAGLDPTNIQNVYISDFPQIPEANMPVTPKAPSGGPIAGIEAVVGEGHHVFIPIVWSGIRLRAGRWAKAIGPVGGLQALMVALPSLVVLWWDVLRCVSRGKGFWKLALAVVSVLVAGVIVGFAGAAYWFTMKLSFLVLGSSGLGDLVFVAAFLAIGYVIQGFSTILDLSGDVARYVASNSARSSAVRTLREILKAVGERAPHADILLMSHSLGSVLASEAMTELPLLAPGRMFLLTLGSPLKSMSRIFPMVVKTPAQIASNFEEHGTAELWMNLWREEDWIGKALNAGGARFIESELGSGLHPNYWSDERVWSALSFVLLGQRPEGQTFQSIWKAIPLGSEEKAEFRRRRRGLLKPFAILLLALFISLSLRLVYVPPWPNHHDLWSRLAVRMTSMLTMGLLALGWYLALTANRERPSEREWLWDLRSADARYWILIGFSFVTGSAVFVLDRLARTHA